jgi:hypothetical protein
VVASSTSASKGSRGADVCLQDPLIDVEGITAGECGMIEVALSLRREGVGQQCYLQFAY